MSSPHQEAAHLSEAPISDHYTLYNLANPTQALVWKTCLFDQESSQNLAQIYIRNITYNLRRNYLDRKEKSV